MTKFRIAAGAVLALAVAVVAFAVPATARNSASSATVITVTEGKPSEFKITLTKKTVRHGAVTFLVTNKGTIPHDFKIAGKKTKMLSPGKKASLTVVLTKGKKLYMCTVTGHAAGGMKGTLTVT
jgi:uncharacterized cupredoxin-like copper-binding protein